MKDKSSYHFKTMRVNDLGVLQEITVHAQPINSPLEHQEFLSKIEISKQFNMRSRGLFEYYSEDLIAYKRELIHNQNRNQFLCFLSEYMTDIREKDCPPSWQECTPEFWEEFIFAFYPDRMKVTRRRREVEKFLIQLEKFLQWLHKRVDLTYYEETLKYIKEAQPELKACEQLINDMNLMMHPDIHSASFNPVNASKRIKAEYNQYANTHTSLFQITEIIDNLVILTDLETGYTYPINGLPMQSTVQSLVIYGSIGKHSNELFWVMLYAMGVYPERGKKYIQLVD